MHDALGQDQQRLFKITCISIARHGEALTEMDCFEEAQYYAGNNKGGLWAIELLVWVPKGMFMPLPWPCPIIYEKYGDVDFEIDVEGIGTILGHGYSFSKEKLKNSSEGYYLRALISIENTVAPFHKSVIDSSDSLITFLRMRAKANALNSDLAIHMFKTLSLKEVRAHRKEIRVLMGRAREGEYHAENKLKQARRSLKRLERKHVVASWYYEVALKSENEISPLHDIHLSTTELYSGREKAKKQLDEAKEHENLMAEKLKKAHEDTIILDNVHDFVKFVYNLLKETDK